MTMVEVSETESLEDMSDVVNSPADNLLRQGSGE